MHILWSMTVRVLPLVSRGHTAEIQMVTILDFKWLRTLRPMCACAPELSGPFDAFCAGAGNNHGNNGHGLRPRAQEQWARGEMLLLIIRVSEGNPLAQLKACMCSRRINVIDSSKFCCVQRTQGSNEGGTSKQEREFPAAVCSCTARKAQAVYGHGAQGSGLPHHVELNQPKMQGCLKCRLLLANSS